MGTEHHHLDLKFEYAQAAPPVEDFRKPFDGDYPVTCDFACHKNRVPPSTAPGVDYATLEGTPALAVADALVYARGQNDIAGRWVELVCHVGEAWYRITYRHLKDYVVRAGFEVLQGQVVGHTGHTGNATGPCLHIDVQRLGAFIDPEGLW